jgi:hypothetical protein
MSPLDGQTMGAQRFIRFQDAALQSAFLSELEQDSVPHTLDSAGSVCFADADAVAAIDAAHRVRDAQFPWFFLRWDTEELTERFAGALSRARLPYFIEYHESGTWVVVRRADKSNHALLTADVIIRNVCR